VDNNGAAHAPSKLILGAFICTGGCLILLMGAMVSIGHWPSLPLQIGGVVAILVVAAAFGLMFETRNHDLIGGAATTRPIVDRLASLVWVIVAIGMAAFFFLLVFFCQTNETPKTFALQLAMPASTAAPTGPQVTTDTQRTVDTEQTTSGKKASHSQQTVDVRQSTSAAPQAPQQSAPALVLWRTSVNAPDPTQGFLPIVLGGLMISAFGVWFPRINLVSANDKNFGSIEKLIAPVLSLALVGAGAGAQVDASHVIANKALTEQGLPPTISAIGQPPVYLASQASLNQTTLDELAKAVETLQTGKAPQVTVTVPAGQDPTLLASVIQKLDDVKGALKGPVSVTYPESAADIATLKGQVSGAQIRLGELADQKAAKKDVDDMAKGQSALCPSLAYEEQQINTRDAVFQAKIGKDKEKLKGKTGAFGAVLPYRFKPFQTDEDQNQALVDSDANAVTHIHSLEDALHCKRVDPAPAPQAAAH
jgi:hypothetical protein